MRTAVHAVGMMIVMVWGAAAASAQGQSPQDRIDTALARAQQGGIPVALLESKIAEGHAKGVPLERIAAAVERRAAALEQATQAVKGNEPVSPVELGVAADAIESGVSAVVLQAVRDAAPRERRAVAIAVLTHLVTAGHVPENALERVREALARGPEALLNLPAEAGSGRGGPPAGLPGGGRGRPDGGVTAGPPAGVPVPGGETQGARPGGPPAQLPGGGPGR
jgi:hypothetical protein